MHNSRSGKRGDSKASDTRAAASVEASAEASTAASAVAKVIITTALYCHPSTYRLFFCKSALMGHAIVGRSIIPPVNPLSVHKLARPNESPLAPEPPAPLCPHQRK